MSRHTGRCADCKHLTKTGKCKLRLGTISEGIPQNPAFNFGNECFRTRNREAQA